jgi:hypothetical protein
MKQPLFLKSGFFQIVLETGIGAEVVEEPP